MKRGFRYVIVIVACLSSIVRADFSQERVKRVSELASYWNGVTRKLLPNFRPGVPTCSEQLTFTEISPLPRYDEAVFDFRIITALMTQIHSDDVRIGIAFNQLGNLSDLIRSTPDNAYYALPGRGQTNLPLNELFNGNVEPRTIAYVARGLYDFSRRTNHIIGLRRATQLWDTVTRVYEAEAGGLVTGYNFATKQRTLDVSHASNIYPWTAAGFKLYVSMADKKRLHGSTRAALASLRNHALPFEYLQAGSLLPVPQGAQKFFGQDKQVSIMGHFAQLLNFLLRSYQIGTEIEKTELPQVVQNFVSVTGSGKVDLLETVKRQFKFFLQEPFVDLNTGLIRNGFFQETNQLVWNGNRAFWQQCEFIAALDRAIHLKLFIGDEALQSLAETLFLKTLDSLKYYFADYNPIAAVITENLGDDDEDRSFIVPIMGYHLSDLMEQLAVKPIVPPKTGLTSTNYQ